MLNGPLTLQHADLTVHAVRNRLAAHAKSAYA